MSEIVGVTGGPGTGKKTLAPLVAKALGLPCESLNELASGYGLVGAGGVVDTRVMRQKVARPAERRALLYGHLFPYVVPRRLVRRVAVLRTEPLILKKRLAARGYAPHKVVENLEAELIGVVSADTFRAYGADRVFEVDTTGSSPATSARKAVRILRGGPLPPVRIDWTAGYDSGRKLSSLLSVK